MVMYSFYFHIKRRIKPLGIQRARAQHRNRHRWRETEIRGETGRRS